MTKRILALVLSLVMLVSLLPVGVLAAETVLDAAIFCSDVHGSTSDLTSVLSGVKASGVNYSSIGFVGDTCLTVANTTSTVQSALGNTDIAVMFSYAASHDTENSADISTNWNYSGEVEGVSDYYLVYTIRETDMQDNNTSEADFTTWYSNLTTAQKKLPIFIMSHRPLHARRNDNANAADWYNVISAAAESSDIVFFWGHNHTSENSVDTAAYYVAKDGAETFTVYNGDTVVPNFTYMNAGYINANNQNPKRINVATTVKITADSLIFQDYNSSGEYTDATYSHNVTVAREFAAAEVTLSSIAISGDTGYYVGDALALKVTATYSDGTTADVTTSATISGYDMSTAGTYTVTATYEGLTATASITVSAPYITSVVLSSAPTKLTYTVGEELDTIGMVVTATYNNGTTADVTAKAILSGYDMNTLGTQTVKVSVNDNGINFNNMSFVITVEKDMSGLTLEKIEITAPPAKTEYLVSEELALDGMVVVATFSDGSTVELAYKPFSTSTLYGGYELDNFSMYVEKAHELKVTYTFGDITCTDSTTINVWNKSFTANGVTVKVATGDYGVTAVNVAESTNANVATAISDVISGDNYVAYDITLTLDADGYALTNGAKTVTLSIPEGVTNPVVYYVSDDGETVTNMNAVKDGSGNVTFTTTHFSTYVIGEEAVIETESGNAVVEGSSTTTTKDVWVKVDAPTNGGEYLIVSTGTAGTSGYVMGNSDAVTPVSGTLTVNGTEGTYTYLETTGTVWTASGSGSSWSFQNADGTYLGYTTSSSWAGTSYTFSASDSTERTWTLSGNNLYFTTTSSFFGSTITTYHYISGGEEWSMADSYNGEPSSSNVYFYQKVTVTETTGTVGHVYSTVGTDITDAVAIAGQTVTLSSILYDTPDGGTMTDITASSGLTPTYEVVTTKGNPNVITSIDGTTATLSGVMGTAVVKVTYTSGDLVAWDEFIVTANAPDHYSINLHKAELTEVTITEFADGVTYYTYNSTTNTYHEATEYVEGETYYTTPVIQGDEITSTIALKGIKKGDTYAVWAVVEAYATSDDTEGVDMGKLGDALSWSVSDESIATIDKTTGVITFTGNNYGTFTVTVSYKGADGQVITDTITISVTDSLYVVPGDGTNDFPEYPNEGAVRFDKTATAVGNYSETGIALVELSMTGVPYTTGSAIDVLLMLDMSTSMDTEVADGVDRVEVTIEAAKAFAKTIVQNNDGTYNDNKIAIKYFNGSSVYTTTDYITVSSDAELEALYDLIEALYTPTDTGTRYSVAMEDAYNTIIAQDAISDNTQALVFMSDGGPTYYTYLNDSGTGTTVSDTDGSTFVGWFDVDDNDTTDETDDTATPNSSFKTEYYSYLLKQAGSPVYTVGLGLSTNDTGPSSYTGLTSGAHEAVTSYILSAMATSASYFYNVADSDAVANMGNIFSGIAASIKEAATDVVVEDKIGNNYSMNFSLPNGVTSDATGDLSEFYIQVVDYVLDSTTHERTGVYTVLENFTFNPDGSLKSHTVDGAACGDTCAHVTTNDAGTITAIDGTYFDYKSDSTGEYLTWEAEKLTSTELALQYFAHLDNSTGLTEEEIEAGKQIPAGTYYTNEYATLTYTNVNGNEVQQEFPVPQMTWNGAQVSYVFYLVNDAGQPVNRAGRVVPFAEAVYVTDVFTYAVVWNDLEQAAIMEAEYLADDIVPEVYALYDNDASYNIHVYEDEEGVNLNNHFVIGGNVTDDYATTNSWTNAKTTYVFNNKSDVTKYNTVGAYIGNDGIDTNAKTTYLCKGDGTATGTISSVSVNSQEEFNSGIYYTKDDTGYLYAQYWVENTTYYAITDASYTAAAGETQKPYDDLASKTGATEINGFAYYIETDGDVYTIVEKNNGSEVHKGFDFSNTTVAFAVVWKPRLETDTVVIDYGLDVVIDVSKNDTLASGVVGVRADAPSGVAINGGTYEAAKAQTVDIYIDANSDADELKELKIGTASVESLTSVRFSLDKENGMQMSKPAIFYYESDCNYYENNELKSNSMYSSVIVIPASTIYYEDEYATLKTFRVDTDDSDSDGDTGEYIEISGWDTSSVHTGKTQEVDRPGDDLISHDYDANNVYGYDAAYSKMATHSMDNAAMVHVDDDSYATAEFTFYGTGFDIISVTSNATGTLIVDTFAGNNTTTGAVKSFIVDTYYGYTQDENGEWIVSTDTANALYQVPVIKASGLTYGQYTVRITALYDSFFAHNETGGYDTYLDAIRIYDPIADDVVVGKDAETDGKDVTVADIYIEDNEGWPTYLELRNNIIEASEFAESEDGTVTDDEFIEGAIFIDGEPENLSVADYVSYGPNNEVYLDKGQSVAFNVSANNTIKTVQLGVKSADGNDVTFAINGETSTVKTTTDMYYDISKWIGDTIVITNSGDSGILSLTNIKFTYSADPNGTESAGSGSAGSSSGGISTASVEAEGGVAYIYMTRSAVESTLAALNAPEPAEPEVPVEPDTPAEPEAPAEPEVFEPEVFRVKLDNAKGKLGKVLKLTITTSDDVERVLINGLEAREGRTDRKTGLTTWTVQLKLNDGGEVLISAVAYNVKGISSEPVETTVTIDAPQSNPGHSKWEIENKNR